MLQVIGITERRSEWTRNVIMETIIIPYSHNTLKANNEAQSKHTIWLSWQNNLNILPKSIWQQPQWVFAERTILGTEQTTWPIYAQPTTLHTLDSASYPTLVSCVFLANTYHCCKGVQIYTCKTILSLIHYARPSLIGFQREKSMREAYMIHPVLLSVLRPKNWRLWGKNRFDMK